MATLSIQLEDGTRSDVSLPAGDYTLGADPTNTIVIDHPSVSQRHCVLQVRDQGGLAVRDLGSTNGTWLDGQRVAQALLLPGQSLHVGTVRVTLAALAPTRLPPRLPVGSRPPRSAPGSPSPSPVAPPSATSLTSQIPDAFAYPFRGNGWLSLVLVVGFDFLMGLLPNVLGVVGWLADFVVGCYLLLLWRQVVLTTIDGENCFPDFPQISLDWNEHRIAFFRFAALALVCFGPALVCLNLVAVPSWVRFSLLGVGWLYFPMALLGFLLTDSFGVLSPRFIARSIARTVPDYGWLVLLGGLSAALLSVATPTLLRVSGSQDGLLQRQLLLGWNIVVSATTLYLAFVWMRLLGLLYRIHRDRLAWV